MTVRYHQWFDVTDPAHNLGQIVLGDGSHSNVVITLASLLVATPSGPANGRYIHHDLVQFSVRSAFDDNVLVLRDYPQSSFGYVLTVLIRALATSNSWADPNDLVCLMDLGSGIGTEGRYAIGYSGVNGPYPNVSATWTTANGRRLFGFANDVSGNDLHVGTRVPWFMLEPTLKAVSHPTIDREVEPVASFAISDSGTHGHGVSREGVAVEREWMQTFEAIAKVLPEHATADHPYTHEQLSRDARKGLPFLVSQGGFGNPDAEVFNLRAEGTPFVADYAVDQVTNRRSITYRTNVRGRLDTGYSAPTLADLLGADLLYWWEPSEETVTFNGGNIAQLDDRVGGAHATQGTAAQQPEYSASGGPGARPCVVLQDASRNLVLPINLSAGHRTGVYAVVSMPAGATLGLAIELGESNDIRIGKTDIGGGTTGFHHRVEFTGGDQSLNISSPGFSTDWNLRAIRPLASGALSQIDGATTNPDVTGTDTFKAWASTSRIGAPVFASGSIAMLALTTEPVAGIDTLVKQYVAQRFGL